MKGHKRLTFIIRGVQAGLLICVVMIALMGYSQQTYAKQPKILVYYDGHMHSTRSDGSGSVADIKEMALNRGLNAVVITDHCKDLTMAEWQSLVNETGAVSDENFLALPGFEMTGSDGIFNRDHFVAFGVANPFVGAATEELCPEEVWESPLNPAGTGPVYPENLAKWVGFIHSQGGLVVHNHPSGSTLLGYGVNNLEVYNQGHVDDVASYAAALGYPPELAWQLGLTLNNFAVYGERDVNMLVPFPGFPDPIPLRIGLWFATANYIPLYIGQWLGSPEAPLSSWDDLLLAYVNGAVDKPIFALANSDAHNTGDLDCNDGSCSAVGLAKNGVYVNKLTAVELAKAVEAGRSFATTGPSLALEVNGKLMGERAVIPQGTASIDLKVNAESQTAILVKVDIIKNGVVWQTVSPFSGTYEVDLSDNYVSQDGYYRVEVTSLDISDGSYHFAWSNPVFVKVP